MLPKLLNMRHSLLIDLYCLLCISTSECMLAYAFAWSKTIKMLSNKCVFDYFEAFFIVFKHAKACASMLLLVEIPNNCSLVQVLIIPFYIQPEVRNIVVIVVTVFLLHHR